MNNLPETSSMFGGFLTLLMQDRVFDYDEESGLIQVSISGTADTRLNTIITAGRRLNFPTQYPFRNLVLRTDGSWGTETEEENLMADLPAREVIRSMFWIDGMTFNEGPSGIQLSLAGDLAVPMPQNHASNRPSIFTARNPDSTALQQARFDPVFPVSIQLDAFGRIISSDIEWSEETNPSLLTTSMGPNGTYSYRDATILFDPSAPGYSSFRGMAHIDLTTLAFSTPGSVDGRIALGHQGLLHRLPGVSFTNNRLLHFHLPGLAWQAPGAFRLELPGVKVKPSHIYMDDASLLRFGISGAGNLEHPSISGLFPVHSIAYGLQGIEDSIVLEGALSIGIGRTLLAYESACLPTAVLSVNPVDLLSTLACSESAHLTLQPGLIAGTSDSIMLSPDADSTGRPGPHLEDVVINLDHETLFKGDLTLEPTRPVFVQASGTTILRTDSLATSGVIFSAENGPGFSFSFDETNQPLQLIPGFNVQATGGGVYFNQEPEVENSAPLSGPDWALKPITVLPIQLTTASDSTFAGSGLIQMDNEFLTLEARGAFFNRADALSGSLRLASSSDNSLSGEARLQIDFPSVIQGDVAGNFRSALAEDSVLAWQVFGYGGLTSLQDYALPGRFTLDQAGLLVETSSPIQGLDKTNVDLQGIELSLWYDPLEGVMRGHSLFQAAINLLSGYRVARTQLHGSLVESRDVKQIIGLNEVFADLPYIYAGALKPWASVAQNTFYAGDARYPVMNSMISRARQLNLELPRLSSAATSSLRNASEALSTGIEAIPATALSNPLVFSSDEVRRFGDQWLADEGREMGQTAVPEIFRTFSESLFNDEERPAYQVIAGAIATSSEIEAVLDSVRISVVAAQRSSEADIYTLESLDPKPLLWAPESVPLDATLRQSPIEDRSWPNIQNNLSPGFSIDTALASSQAQGLVEARATQETLDLQFIRTIGSMELNLVNLKIVHSPDQARDFLQALEGLNKYYSAQINADWSLYDWAESKISWLRLQRPALQDGIQRSMATTRASSGGEGMMKRLTLARYNHALSFGSSIDWQPEFPGESYASYLDNLSGSELDEAFSSMAMALWYELPLEMLQNLRTDLLAQLEARESALHLVQDSVTRSYSRYTRALDPLYAAQTELTTLLYGVADEYKRWRSGFPHLDPDAVNFAFQFLPYRGNYRYLAEDLEPPVINSISVESTRDGFSSSSALTWEAEHPVELTSSSISILPDSTSGHRFLNIANQESVRHLAVRNTSGDPVQSYDVALRVRGAGGLATTHYGRFQVAVQPDAIDPSLSDAREVLPADNTPPTQPRIEALRYSSYFSEKPNVLAFQLAPLLDPESGIASMEYALFNANDDETVYQDWTPIPIGTRLFTGRIIETGITAQELEPDIEVRVRATNGAGLSSMATERISLSLDESQPDIQIEQIDFIPSFSTEYQDLLEVTLNRISDPESGITRVEYALARGQEAQLSTESWSSLLTINRPIRELEPSPIEVPLPELLLADDPAPLTIFVRVTNGAGLQALDSRMIELPGKDATPPSEPAISFRQIPETQAGTVSLEVLIGESSDTESGLAQVLFRILNGSDGTELITWQDFVFLDPSQAPLHLPRSQRTFTFSNLTPGTTLIAEAQVINRAGLASTKAIEFVSLFKDDTPPEPPIAFLRKRSSEEQDSGSLALVIGPGEDLDTGIQTVAYRFVDPLSQVPVQGWTPVFDSIQPVKRFSGQTIPIPTLPIVANQPALTQVRILNGAGLSAIVTAQLSDNLDITPPLLPEVRLQFVPSDSVSTLYMLVGQAFDQESSISTAEYRVINADTGKQLTAGWQALSLLEERGILGEQLIEIPIDLEQPGNLRAEVRLLNSSGFESIQRVVSYVDPRLIVDISPPAAPTLRAYTYLETENENPGIQIVSGPMIDAQSGIDSLVYRIVYSSPEGMLQSRQKIETMPWSPVDLDEGIVVENVSHRVSKKPEFLPAEGLIQMRVVNGEGLSTVVEQIVSLRKAIDLTAPEAPLPLLSQDLQSRSESLPLTIISPLDVESGLSKMEYRIRDEATDEVVVEWTDVEFVQGMQSFSTGFAAFTPPDRDRILVEVRTTNGAGLSTATTRSVSFVQDPTPPRIEQPRLAFNNLYQEHQPATVEITIPEVTDPESKVQSLSYRLIAADSSSILSEWTSVPIIASNEVQLSPIQLDLPDLSDGAEIQVEVKATNEKGLESLVEASRTLELDRSPPLAPNLEVDYIQSALGDDYLQIESASFRDVESGIAGVAYRVIDTDDEQTHLDWTPIPLFKDTRISTPRLTIPRSTFAFGDTRPVRIELQATNGAGLSTLKTAQVLIPGDNTAPEEPQLLLVHRNGYAPQNPNTLEIQIAPLSDPQSAIEQVSYRVVDQQNSSEILSWTEIPLISTNYFPGSLQYVSLDEVNGSSTLSVEVQVTNRAGLQIASQDQIDIAIETDRSPPVAEISLHYFSSEMALVFEELLDRESNIQQVEYRFVDNVDQSVLADWQDLFEIAIPQQVFPRKSFTIPQPPSRTGRTIKVDVRITNGAGLQSVVSKTILFRQGGEN